MLVYTCGRMPKALWNATSNVAKGGNMKLLVTGAGGREHSIVWKLAQNEKVTEIYVCPGNAGCETVNKVKNVSLANIDEILAFAKEKAIDLTILGSEELAVAGIVDRFAIEGLKVFGPHQAAAMLEGSKAVAKEFMKKYNVKTAAYETFEDYDKAKVYVENGEFPVVIKASGLAAGKGVIIALNLEEAIIALKEIMIEKKFGDSGNEVVIEEFLEGVEASILSIYDGNTIIPFVSAKDHKKIGERETGLNTGGMGVIAPNPYVTAEVNEAFYKDILNPTLEGLKAEYEFFAGIIFFGLMINKRGVYLLEYNMRLGDPETQVVLALMENDLLELIDKAMVGKMNEVEVKWANKSACCVVLAAGGYPEEYKKGDLITGTDTVDNLVFMAGVKQDNGFKTNGGRVLNVVALGDTLEEARKNAYADVDKIKFDGAVCRRDIGVLYQ